MNPNLPVIPKANLSALKPNLKKLFYDFYSNARLALEASCEHQIQEGEPIEKAHLAPFAFFINYDLATDTVKMGNAVALSGSMQNDEAKESLSFMLRQCGCRFKATVLITVMEAWSVNVPKEAVAGKTPQQANEWLAKNRPSLNPDRVEVAMITMELKGHGSYTFMAEIHRDETGRPSLDEEPPEVLDCETDGRFSDILNYNPTHPTPFEAGEEGATPDVPGMALVTPDEM